MGKKAALIIIGIGLLAVLLSTQGGSTGGRWSDIESVSGNVATGWTGYQSDCLIVDTSDLWLNPAGKWICCVYVMNECDYDIIIDKVRLSWEPDEGEELLKIQIWRYEMLEWHGRAPSGTVIDFEDSPLLPGESVCICLFFDSDMHGKAFTIEFIMGDGSSAVASFETPAMTQAQEESYLEESSGGEEPSCEQCCPGSLDHIEISPDSATITAGETQVYTAEAFDQLGNSLGDVTGSTSFDIDTEAGGSWAGNEYTSENAGTWTVTGTHDGQSDNSSLTVNPGSLDHIVISPDSATITAGETQVYAADAFDLLGNSLGDVTAGTTFTIDAEAGGSWAANEYTSEKAGTWTVTGTCDGQSATASLTVNPGSLDHIVISPDSATITADETQVYTAEAFDLLGNSLGDVTGSTSFDIDAGAGGSWAGNEYTSGNAGPWTVTGTYDGQSDNSSLTVNAGPSP